MDVPAEKEFRLEQLLPLIQQTLNEGHTVRFSPRGISMLPMLRQGRDTVTLAPVDRELKKYDIPLYRRDNGAFVLHRIVKVGDTLTCIGDNQYEPEYGIRMDQVIGVVTAFSRDDRNVEVTDAGYQIYCRLWHWFRPVRHFLIRLRRFLGAKWRRFRTRG